MRSLVDRRVVEVDRRGDTRDRWLGYGCQAVAAGKLTDRLDGPMLPEFVADIAADTTAG